MNEVSKLTPDFNPILLGDCMKKYLIITMMALIMGFGTIALAAENKGGAFARMDTNNDGKIDLQEFKNRNDKRQEAAFKAADTNNDGSL